MKKIDPFKVRKGNKRSSKRSLSSSKKNDIARAVKLIEKIQEIKEFYKELDLLTQKLLEAGFTEGFVEGKHIVMKDLFSTKNTIWKSTPQRRYELEIA